MSQQVNAQPPCPYEKWCGGCSWQHLPYAEQLGKKQAQVDALMKKYGAPEPIVGMNYPYYYRNKAHAVFGGSVRGKIVCGTYEKNSHRIVNIAGCQIEDRRCDAVIATVRDLLPSFRIDPYNEDTGRGLLRHVVVRRGFATNEMMVILVTASPEFPSKRNFVAALRRAHPEITTIIHNINGQNTSMVLGERSDVLFGPGYIEDVLLGCRFRISPGAFYQVNPAQTKKLYRLAIEMADLKGGERILDAYCGTGTIGITALADASRRLDDGKRSGKEGSAESLTGVELNADAVRDARVNAKCSRLTDARFIAADATKFMREEAARGMRYDVVFMDPPRSGSTEEFLGALRALAPERIIYISCNPETQARDLSHLTGAYRIARIAPVDLFPFTDHVENVVSLIHK